MVPDGVSEVRKGSSVLIYLLALRAVSHSRSWERRWSWGVGYL